MKLDRSRQPVYPKLFAFAMVLSLLGTWACSEDSPTQAPPPPPSLELSDLIGVWQCEGCEDMASLGQPADHDSTLFLSVRPDSSVVLYCRRETLRWSSFSSDANTMQLTARGFLTNQTDMTISWTGIGDTGFFHLEYFVFGNLVLEEVRRKVPNEPECSGNP